MGLGAVILTTSLVHPTGVLLHPAGTVLSLPRIKALREAGFTQLFLLEPGETAELARQALATEALPLARIRTGDRLGEDLRSPDGVVLAPAGSTIDARLMEAAGRAGVDQAVIRARGLDHSTVLVLEYVGALPPQAPFQARLTDPAIIPLLAPRGKVAVSVQAEAPRSLILGALGAEGHEAQEHAAAADAVRLVRLQQADVAIIDAADATEVRPILLDPTRSRTGAVLALGSDLKGAQVQRILECGVNDLLPSPPTAETVLDRMMAGLQAGGRRTRTAPHLVLERRETPRAKESASCRVLDLLSGASLPLPGAQTLDRSEGGVRIAYRPPDRRDAQWVRSRTVHPLHFLYPHAQANGLGNDLLVSLALPGRAPLEARARVVWVEIRRETEEAGLIFRNGMTTVRRAPPSSARRLPGP
jgi:hypothetical protein